MPSKKIKTLTVEQYQLMTERKLTNVWSTENIEIPYVAYTEFLEQVQSQMIDEYDIEVTIEEMESNPEFIKYFNNQIKVMLKSRINSDEMPYLLEIYNEHIPLMRSVFKERIDQRDEIDRIRDAEEQKNYALQQELELAITKAGGLEKFLQSIASD